MKKKTAILKLMATARSLEKGDLYSEGAEADFSHILDEYAQKLVKKSDSLPCVSSCAIEFEVAIGLLRDLADVQNGAPLETYRKEWEGIMEATYKFLNKHES